MPAINKNTNNNANKENDWIQILSLYEFKRYNKMISLFELAKTCKSMRLHLESLMFNKLELFKNEKIKHGKRYKNINPRKVEQVELIRKMKHDLHTKRHLVKFVIIYNTYTNQFAQDFFKLFPNIAHIRIEFSNGNKFTTIYSTLKYAKNLEKLELRCDTIYEIDLKTLKSDTSYFKLLISLRKLEKSYNTLNYSKLYVNDPIFNCITQISINHDNLLSYLTQTQTSRLINVKFTKNRKFISNNLVNFITNNRQLVGLEISRKNLSQRVVASLGGLKELRYFTH
jgi:hypothetical protein